MLSLKFVFVFFQASGLNLNLNLKFQGHAHEWLGTTAGYRVGMTENVIHGRVSEGAVTSVHCAYRTVGTPWRRATFATAAGGWRTSAIVL